MRYHDSPMSIFVSICAALVLVVGSGCGDTEEDVEQSDVQLSMLGLSQSTDFRQTGTLNLSLLPRDKNSQAGLSKRQLEYDVRIVEPTGISVLLDRIEHSPPTDLGQYAILMDSSGSIRSYKTERDEAAKVLIEEMFRYSNKSKIGLFDWSGSNHPTGAQDVNSVYDFADISQQQDLLDAADQIGTRGSTPLHDSMYELLVHLDATKQSNTTLGMIALSDGADTGSQNDVDDLIQKAQELDVRIYSIGIGRAARGNSGASSRAIAEAERLADETGGVYISVEDVAGLSQFARDIAQGATQGFDKTSVQLDPIPSPGTTLIGNVKASGAKVRSSNTVDFELDIK